MTFFEAQMKVAESFAETMREFGFESFAEMRDCYWWTSNDIKKEVEGRKLRGSERKASGDDFSI